MISICIPFYNVEKFIENCARSVFEQTYQEWEAIFIDDSSPDNSLKILELLLLKYPEVKEKVHIIRHEHNYGLAIARNTGVNIAKGEFIMHLDADDWLEPTAIEILLKKQQETNADIVSGNAICNRQNGDVILQEPEYSNAYEMTMKMIEMNISHSMWRRLIRKSLYIDNGIFAIEGVNIGEDHYTMPRLSFYAERVAKVDKIVYHYNCLNSNSYTFSQKIHSFNYDRYTNDRDSLKILLDFFLLRDKNIYDKVKEINKNFFLSQQHFALLLGDWDTYKIVNKDFNTDSYLIIFYLKSFVAKIIYYGEIAIRKFLGEKNYIKLQKLRTLLKNRRRISGC